MRRPVEFLRDDNPYPGNPTRWPNQEMFELHTEIEIQKLEDKPWDPEVALAALIGYARAFQQDDEHHWERFEIENCDLATVTATPAVFAEFCMAVIGHLPLGDSDEEKQSDRD